LRSYENSLKKESKAKLCQSTLWIPCLDNEQGLPKAHPRVMILAMAEQHRARTYLYKIEGYYLIPHELLHVLAYRLIGKPCRYEWGDHHVRSLQPKNRREKLFVLLFPFVVCWGLGFFFGFLWLLSAFTIDIPPAQYFVEGPTWHILFLVMGALFILYSGTAHKDLLDAFAWLFIYKEAE
jgi:hypothetical protein